MRTTVYGIAVEGTAKEIAKVVKYAQESRFANNFKYSREAQISMFNRQEAEMWRNIR